MGNTRKRYVFIDILKGISIILVVYGHIIPGAVPLFTEYAGTFRMPLFFFVSGILFSNTRYKNNFKEFIYKRYKGLIVPFCYFSTIVLLGYWLIEADYIAFLKRIVKTGWGGYALWFIPVLFGAQLLFYPLCKIVSKWLLPCVLLLGVVSYLSSVYIGFVPYNLCLCFCGAYFFGLGNYFKRFLYMTKYVVGSNAVWIFLVGILISLLYLIEPRQPEWFINKVPSLIFYVSPLGAILSLSVLSIAVERIGFSKIINFFSICGKQSCIILAFHQIICMITKQYVPSKVTISIMIVSLSFLVWFIPKHLPWMLGKAK